MKRTVVILLSDKRSGSTMVQDALCLHPQIQHVAYSPHRYFETHHWLKAAVVLDSPAEDFSGRRTYPGYGSRSNARVYLQDCIRGNLPNYQFPADDRSLVFDSWQKLCENYAQPVFFEKSPQYLANWAALSLMLEWMETTDFDVKIIGLVRNPLSVQYSAQRLFHTDPAHRQFGWMEIYQNLRKLEALLPSSSYRLVRYEDLIADPGSHFAELQAFLGLAPNNDVGVAVHGMSVDKWSQDRVFDLQLDDAVKKMAKSFGYTDEELTNPVKPPLPAYRKQYQRLLGGYRGLLSQMRYRVLHPLRARMRITRR